MKPIFSTKFYTPSMENETHEFLLNSLITLIENENRFPLHKFALLQWKMRFTIFEFFNTFNRKQKQISL